MQDKTRLSNTGMLGLILLATFYPIVETTNWLRIAALEARAYSDDIYGVRPRKVLARVLGMYAGASALLWLFICVFGTIAVLATGTSAEGDLVQAFLVNLASQQNEVADLALWLLVVSLIAMAVSTMSAMFSSSLATIRYDILPATLGPEFAQPPNEAFASRGGSLRRRARRLVLTQRLLRERLVSDRAARMSLPTLSIQPARLGPADRWKFWRH